jgi:hypothetical protein
MRLVRLVMVLAPIPFAAQAQQTPPSPPRTPVCADSLHHAFDYWVGEWDVYNPAGQLTARSTIQSVSAGCAITEHWQPLGGNPDGFSISWYEPRDGQWHQQWVGGGGWIDRFTGQVTDGVLSMVTDAPNAQGQFTRMTYLRPADGGVIQFLETSADSGKTWQPSARLTYRRKG